MTSIKIENGMWKEDTICCILKGNDKLLKLSILVVMKVGSHFTFFFCFFTIFLFCFLFLVVSKFCESFLSLAAACFSSKIVRLGTILQSLQQDFGKEHIAARDRKLSQNSY